MAQTINTQKSLLWLAWVGAGLTLLGFIGMIWLQAAGCQNLFDPSHPQPAQAYGWGAVPFMCLTFALLGTLIITFRPENRIGWIAIYIGLTSMAYFLSIQVGPCAYDGIISSSATVPALWLSNLLVFLMTIGLGLFAWVFPTGRFLTPRWKQLCLWLISMHVVLSTISLFWPGALLLRSDPNPFPELQNPLAFPIPPSPFWEAAVFQGINLFGNLIILFGFIALFWRWWRSQGDERQQIKWLALFLLVFGTQFIVVEVVGVNLYPAIFDGWFYLFDVAMFFIGFPVVFGIAIFKYRLYDIDIIIRRTVQYAAVSAVLVATYYGSVLLLQTIFTSTVGEQSPLVIVISTLLTAALFNPLRTRLQTFIDRRFYRQKYNAEQILSHFAQTARDEVEIETLTNELAHVVQETMQPESISVWLKQ